MVFYIVTTQSMVNDSSSATGESLTSDPYRDGSDPYRDGSELLGNIVWISSNSFV